MNNQELKEMKTALTEMKTQLEKTRDSLVEIGRIAYFIDSKLQLETSNSKEFSLNEISTALNSFIDEFIYKYSASNFDYDDLGNLEYDRDGMSINVYFDVDSMKLKELVKDGIESFVTHFELKLIDYNNQSSTDEA